MEILKFRQHWQHAYLASKPQLNEPRKGLKRQDSPAQDHIIIKEIDLDVLQSNGLIETLWNQEPEKPTQVWGVEEGHTDLLRESLQQWN